MAGVISTTITFASNNAVTPTKLNQITTGSSFTSQAILGTTLGVTGGQLHVGTITSNEMGTASVTTVALSSQCVTSAKIADGNVTAAKLATDSVTADKIGDEAVGFAKIAPAALATQSKMQSESDDAVITPEFVRYSPGVAKASGNVAISGTGRTINSAYNVSANGTRNSTTSTTITLTDDMANENYTVLLTLYTDGTATTSDATVSARTVGSFTIKHPPEGAPYERIAFAVFGTLA